MHWKFDQSDKKRNYVHRANRHAIPYWQLVNVYTLLVFGRFFLGWGCGLRTLEMKQQLGANNLLISLLFQLRLGGGYVECTIVLESIVLIEWIGRKWVLSHHRHIANKWIFLTFYAIFTHLCGAQIRDDDFNLFFIQKNIRRRRRCFHRLVAHNFFCHSFSYVKRRIRKFSMIFSRSGHNSNINI